MSSQLISSITFLYFMSVSSLLNSKRAIQRLLVTVIPSDTYPACRSKLSPVPSKSVVQRRKHFLSEITDTMSHYMYSLFKGKTFLLLVARADQLINFHIHTQFLITLLFFNNHEIEANSVTRYVCISDLSILSESQIRIS